jgi:signal transduction histidine kinase/putative methionine-R-sulfoxide reductase with GAF domain
MDTQCGIPAALEVLQQLTEIPLVHQDEKVALKRIVELTREALHSRLCTLVRIDLEKQSFIQYASADPGSLVARPNRTWECSLLPVSISPFVELARTAQRHPTEIYDLGAGGREMVSPALAQQYELESALCCPLYVGEQLIGYLNHFVATSVGFTVQDRHCVELIARQAAVVMALVERIQKAAGYDHLQQLNEIMQEITLERTAEQLMGVMLERAITLVGAERGWVSQLDMATGELQIAVQRGDPPPHPALSIGQGITGKALAEEQPQRADDVREPPWRDTYVAYWPDTISELAVPMRIGNAEVRIGAEVRHRPKPIGVLNLESPRRAAFSSADENLLLSLAGHAAVLIDRLDLDRKWARLAEVQQRIVGRHDWNSIIDDMLHTITATLGYAYVNISLVDERMARIRTEYVTGIPDQQADEFKRLADHALDSSDIQADIVRTRRIEVPAADDARFDREVFQRFGHANMLRVFVPLVAPSTNRVIGTVEAGHLHSMRTHLYEHDVQILKGFVDYVAQALEQRQRGQMERITHELRSPVVGIRSNASYLQRRLRTLPEELVQRKLGDILADCEILLYQVAGLEHTLGQPSRESKIERTLVFRDIIIKTVTQLRPLVVYQGSDPDRIAYDPADVRRIRPLYVDRGHLNQVVFNLLHNAIKYAEDDPEQFRIQIKVEHRPRDYVLVFRDWGIGIGREYRDSIFEEGFRTPEALQKQVTGNGLGLSISKRLMQQMGGDLRLVSFGKPTEFQVILPQKLAEAPNDYDG